MKELNLNPFIVQGYAGAKYFCDREDETKRIIGAIKNQRNLTISSVRKMGKTGLIYHILDKLKRSKEFETIYIDIYDTTSVDDFVNRFGTEILRTQESFSSKLKRSINDFIKSIRPTISYDSLSGIPSFSFYLENDNLANSTLAELFNFLESRASEKKIVIAIDEFQQISNYENTNLEASLRTLIQKIKNVQFIFSGSDKHLLSNIFTNVKRPFYQSTELMHLEEIPTESYVKFISKKFKEQKIEFNVELVKTILTWTRRHTYYVQYLCNKIVGSGEIKMDNNTLKKIMLSILIENESYYFEYKNLITLQQWKLLIAIAKEENIKEITSSAFIKNHNLSNASTVRRGIKSLQEKEMIYKKEDKYYIYDVFFSRWLERK